MKLTIRIQSLLTQLLVITEFAQVLLQSCLDFLVQSIGTFGVIGAAFLAGTLVNVTLCPLAEAGCDLFQSADWVISIIPDHVIGGA